MADVRPRPTGTAMAPGPQGGTSASPTARTGAVIMVASGAGLAFGALTSMVNLFSSAYGPAALVPGEGVVSLQFLSRLLDALWAWSLLPFVVGWFVRRRAVAVAGGVGAIVAAVVGYYVSDAALGRTELETELVAVWALTGVVGAPLMALLGGLARGRGPVGLVTGLAAPGLMVAVVLVDGGAVDSPVDVWVDRTVFASAAAITCGLLVRSARSRMPARSSRP